MKDAAVHLRHVLQCIERLEEYTAAGWHAFLASPMIQDACIRNLQVMAESTQRLSEQAKALHPEIEWKALAGFRNVLVHDYLGVDIEQVYRMIEQDVPSPRKACLLLLPPEP